MSRASVAAESPPTPDGSRARTRGPGVHAGIRNILRRQQAQHQLHNGKRPVSRNGAQRVPHRFISRNQFRLAFANLAAATADHGFPFAFSLIVEFFVFQTHKQPMGDLCARLARQTQGLDAYLLFKRAHAEILAVLRTRRDLHFTRWASPAARPPRFIRRTFGDELILELPDKTLHRPRTGFTKGADGASAGNVVRDAEQVIRVALPAFTMREAMQRLAHPERALAAGRALAATLMRVKLSDVGQRFDAFTLRLPMRVPVLLGVPSFA